MTYLTGQMVFNLGGLWLWLGFATQLEGGLVGSKVSDRTKLHGAHITWQSTHLNHHSATELHKVRKQILSLKLKQVFLLKSKPPKVPDWGRNCCAAGREWCGVGTKLFGPMWAQLGCNQGKARGCLSEARVNECPWMENDLILQSIHISWMHHCTVSFNSKLILFIEQWYDKLYGHIILCIWNYQLGFEWQKFWMAVYLAQDFLQITGKLCKWRTWWSRSQQPVQCPLRRKSFMASCLGSEPSGVGLLKWFNTSQ